MILLKKIKTLVNRLLPSVKRWRDRNRDFHNAKETLILSKELSNDEKRILEKISLRVHDKDTMYNKYGGALHYLLVGLSANRCINQALKSVQKELSINNILDFPCGHGRVLRYLKANYPNASITGSELDPDALKFCRNNFSVNSLLSKNNFSKISTPKEFDLIWCGSLLTHITELASIALLKFFHDHLSENGLCIFTTHGAYTKYLIQSKEKNYGLEENAQEELLNQYIENGYGYTNYRNNKGYGVSIANQKKITELALSSGQWKQIMFLEKGWDNHQDVYALQKYSKN